MDHRNAARVLPDPVGALMRVSSPRAMAAHPAELVPEGGAGGVLNEGVDGPQKRREGLAGSGGRADEGVLPPCDGGPPRRLGGRGLPEPLRKPAPEEGVEEVQRHPGGGYGAAGGRSSPRRRPRSVPEARGVTLLRRSRVGHLATADARGRPHVVPVCFAFDGRRIVTALDEKPKRVGPRRLRRVRNIRVNPHVAFIVDRYDEDWRRLRFVLVLGVAD